MKPTEGDALRASPATRPLRGRLGLPGDKSISHRALLLAAVADGTSRIRGLLDGNDCRATAACLANLGVAIARDGDALRIAGRGLEGLAPPARPLDCQRSGTTMRLLCGLLAGQRFGCELTGEPQLRRRPMDRITEPLAAMGAKIASAEIDGVGGRAPLRLAGCRPGDRLAGRVHELAVSSAQVKSALLLAGLRADGPTTVAQPLPSRDHTERLLAAMGAEVTVEQGGARITVAPAQSLTPLDLDVPGDLSSAAFPIVAATLVAGSEILIEGVGVNPTRAGLLDVLTEMGAELTLEGRREGWGEPVADLRVRAPARALRGVEIGGATVVRAIDELPILALAATQAEGRTVIRDAAELRVKETDRIVTTAATLSALGARIEPRPDGLVIEGPTPLSGGRVDSAGDHRLAMTLAVAGLIAESEVTVERARCVGDSFPGFVALMQGLGAPLGW